MSLQQLGGQWKVIGQDITYGGELLWDRERGGIQLQLYNLANDEDVMADIPIHGKIVAIEGTLINGARIVLFDCRTGARNHQILSKTTLTIYAKLIFWGLKVHNTEELVFNEFILNFGNITDWAGICRYESDYANQSLKWINEPNIELSLDKHTLIIGCTGTNYIGDLTESEITIKQSVYFQIKPKQKWTIPQFLEELVCLRNLISLGVQQKVGLDKVTYYHECNRDENISEYLHPAEVSLDIAPVEIQNVSSRDYLFTLQELCDSNYKINNWFEKYEKIKPVIDLYASSYLYTDISAEMFFLNLTQALETYHSRFVCATKKEYIELVQDFIKTIYGDINCKNAQDRLDYLMPKYQYRLPELILKTRLRHLFFVNHGFFFYTSTYKLKDFIDKLVDSRNYYTHYDVKKEDKAFKKAELPMVNSILLNVISYYILIELGFDEEVCLKKIRERQAGLTYHDMIMNQNNDA